ncbi:MAG: DUF3018 family protein [Gemmatimonadota bacterium]|jgi:hypothetical protein
MTESEDRKKAIREKEEAHRQSVAAAQSSHEADDQGFIDGVSDFGDE